MDNVILDGLELMNTADEPNNYLIEGFLWEHDHIMLLAKEKVGKSILAIQMACSLSCGEPFLGEYEVPEPMQVLYIQTESTRHETVERLRSMTSKDGVNWNPENFFLYHTHSLALDSETGMNFLIKLMQDRLLDPRVIFIDPLYMSMEGSLVDDWKCRSMSKNVRRLGELYNAAIVLVHHEHRARSNKDGHVIEEGDNSIMGSFVWKAFPSHIIHLRMSKDGMRAISCTTQRNSRVVRDMRMILNQPFPLLYKIFGTPDHPNYVTNVFDYIKERGKKCANEVHEETGLSLSAVKKSLSYLIKPNVNKLYKVNQGQRPTYYAVVDSPTPNDLGQNLTLADH